VVPPGARWRSRRRQRGWAPELAAGITLRKAPRVLLGCGLRGSKAAALAMGRVERRACSRRMNTLVLSSTSSPIASARWHAIQTIRNPLRIARWHAVCHILRQFFAARRADAPGPSSFCLPAAPRRKVQAQHIEAINSLFCLDGTTKA